MGKVILCSGDRTERPYVFPRTGVRIYSIEELCYYLYHNVYLIEESLFTDSLIDWIGTELKLVDRAAKLKALKAKKADLKTLVTVVLCSSDYYGEKEILAFLRRLDRVIDMPRIKRIFVKANELLKDHQYTLALNEYERILSSEGDNNLTPKDFGDVLHNKAIATAQSKSLKEAVDIFRQAYEYNHNEESLRQFLYAVLLSGEDVDEIAGIYNVDDILKEEVISDLEQIREEAKLNDSMTEIQRLKQYKAEGRNTEFYELADKMIERWKASVRKVYQ
ncbi:MAG: hypothetical protein GX359_11275 [Clostridiales bacterium]|nr:hypothetical protein [Clostridiales bacterium]